MSPERTAVRHVRAVNPQNLRAQPVAVLLAICCLLSSARGQWLEKTIALSDSLGDLWPNAVYFVPGGNCVYVAGEDGVMVVDATTNARVARIDMDEPMFMAFDSHDNKVYMSGRESLSVIDPMSHQVLVQLHVGSNPTRLLYNPAANKVYCLMGSRRDTVAVVDCSTDSVLARIWVGRTDYDYVSVCCNPAGNKVYVPSDDEGTVAVIDGAGDSLLKLLDVGNYPDGLVYCPVSNKLYCSASYDDEVAIFDAGPDTLLRLIDIQEHPVALGYSPVSNKVYCGDGYGYIHIIDCYTDTILASLGPVDHDPMFFVFDSVDNRVFCFSDYYYSIPAISGSGDTIVGSVEFHGDAYEPDPACYDPQQNRLYLVGRSSADVTVVDAAAMRSFAAVQMEPAPSRGCYSAPQDKLYCSDEESGLIAVINCSTDSLVRRIFTPGSNLTAPVFSSDFNKLYYEADMIDNSAVFVVDCARDSLSAVLPLNVNGNASAITVYNPTVGRVYCLAESTVVAIDCAGDSIVARVPVGFLPCALACNPDSNLVYCASYRAESLFISAIDCSADTLAGSVFVHAGFYWGNAQMCYVPSRDVVVSQVPNATLVVVDGKAGQVLQTVPLDDRVSQFYLDRNANELYLFPDGSADVGVIDCRDMSVKAIVRVAARLDDLAFDSIANRVWATSPGFGCISLVDGRTERFLGLFDAGQSPGDITWVPQHRKMCVVDERGQAILVVRDTSLAGVHENSASPVARAMPTIVHGVLFLPKTGTVPSGTVPIFGPSLLDAAGRKVLDLKPGANDVRCLAPGVYFVRDAQAQAQAIRKVVVAR